MKRQMIVAVALLGLLLTACADPDDPAVGGSTTAPGAIEHATGASDLVFRFGYAGGFTPVEYQLTNTPAFSLYGDGTIVVPGAQIEIYPGPALPALEARAVTEEGIQAILRRAIDAGLGTVDDLTDMGSVGIADASDAVFTLRAGGLDRTVRVYALSELGDRRPPGMAEDEFAARRRLQSLVDDLSSMNDLVPSGAMSGDPAPYQATGSRVFVGTYRGDGELPQPAASWPLETPLATFGTGQNGYAYTCGAVTGEDWADLLLPAATQANQLTPWRSDGQRYALLFRPLLPDETGC